MAPPNRNAFIVPVVYFFYPETAYRSLEEMDSIFRKTTSWLSVVRVAHDEPRRYGKSGEILIDYDDTEEHRLRQPSVFSASARFEAGVSDGEKGRARGRETLEGKGRDPGEKVEGGFGFVSSASGSGSSP